MYVHTYILEHIDYHCYAGELQITQQWRQQHVKVYTCTAYLLRAAVRSDEDIIPCKYLLQDEALLEVWAMKPICYSHIEVPSLASSS